MANAIYHQVCTIKLLSLQVKFYLKSLIILTVIRVFYLVMARAFLIENDEESSFITSTSGSEGKLAESLYCTDVSETMFGKDLEQIGFVNQNGKKCINGQLKWYQEK